MLSVFKQRVGWKSICEVCMKPQWQHSRTTEKYSTPEAHRKQSSLIIFVLIITGNMLDVCMKLDLRSDFN